jgi:hypothetical protein
VGDHQVEARTVRVSERWGVTLFDPVVVHCLATLTNLSIRDL